MTDPKATGGHASVDAAYRAESRRVLATLIRLLGDFDLAEEALQHAFRAALEQWPRDGVPDNPRAWLVSAGRFKAIDAVRRRARFDALETEETSMRFMIIVKATKESEAGEMPKEQLLQDMMKFNEELVRAGVMVSGDGLHPSSKGARVRFSGKNRTVVDGPFAETKELIAGFRMWQVNSREEAIEWVRRCPNPFETGSEIEIRQVFEGPELTQNEEILRKEEELRAQSARNAGR